MTNRRDLLQKLLEGLSALEEFREPPEQVAPQFGRWLVHVKLALEGAGMSSETETWKDALKNVSFYDDDSSLFVQMSSAKAILLGFLERATGDSPAVELFSPSIVEETPGYVRRVAEQANGCYERGWYDACAVMLRRLIETLIIECFERHSLESKITGSDGNYCQLGELISRFLAERWHTSRAASGSLKKLTDIKGTGDLSAHSRRFLATRNDIDRIAQDVRIAVQELAYIAAAGSADTRG
jgi:hypothetical protein